MKADPGKDWARYLATWFGSGLSPVMPGTFGSVAALPFAWLIQSAYGDLALRLSGCLLFLAGVPICRAYLARHGGDDPGEVVIDEVAGMWLLASMLPPSWRWYLVAFLLFRLFDVIKPWPISFLDRRIKGALGIMLDDAAAAAYPMLLAAGLIWALGQSPRTENLPRQAVSYLESGSLHGLER